MSIWKTVMTPEEGNKMSENTLVNHLGINMVEIGDDYVKATMPVDKRTHQPFGILHGGASVALAETLGSYAAHLAAEPGTTLVGLEINANHVKSVREGFVTGVARPIHLGRTTQIWDIKITDEKDNLVCTSRLTMAALVQNK